MAKLLNFQRRRFKTFLESFLELALCTFLAIYLFPSDHFFKQFVLFKGDNIVHQNYAIKHVDHHARLRVKRRACLPRFLRSKRPNFAMFSECARLFRKELWVIHNFSHVF